jgi:hypothetical protein
MSFEGASRYGNQLQPKPNGQSGIQIYQMDACFDHGITLEKVMTQ